jgi:transposase-like protein
VLGGNTLGYVFLVTSNLPNRGPESAMKKKASPARPRNARRRLERAAEKLERDRERLFVLSPGGSAERPIAVEAAAVVDVRALSVPCPRCEGPHELVEHAAVLAGGERLREARLRCRRCGTRRSLFFRLEERRLN